MIKPDDVEGLNNQAGLLAEIAPNLGHWLDYSIEGLRAVDDYFDHHVVDGVIKEGSRFEAQGDRLLFCFGAYVGEVILRAAPGVHWCLDEEPDENLWRAYVH